MVQINWGIIECGNVTEVKSGTAFNLVDHSRLVAFNWRNTQLAEDYVKKHNVVSRYSNAGELIQAPDVNSINVATPPNSHAEDNVSAIFTFESNITCTGVWSFSCSQESNRDTIEIVGDEEYIIFFCFNIEQAELLNKYRIRSFEFPKPDHLQYNLIGNIVQDLKGNSESPSHGLFASRTNWVIDEVLKEYYTKN